MAIHHNESYWPDAGTFNPERFFGKSEKAPNPLQGRNPEFPMAADRPRRPLNVMDAAEAVFKPAPAKAPDPVPVKRGLPKAKQMVSLRLDQDVLEHFQAQGRDWQERINDDLRKAAGLA